MVVCLDLFLRQYKFVLNKVDADGIVLLTAAFPLLTTYTYLHFFPGIVMKSLFLSFALLLGVAFGAAAQMKDRHSERIGSVEPAPERVDAVTRQMSNQLRLSEAQYIRLRAVNKIKLAKADEIQWQYHDDPAGRNAKLMELETQYETECGRILTPTQLSMFQNEQKRDAVPTPPAGNDGGVG